MGTVAGSLVVLEVRGNSSCGERGGIGGDCGGGSSGLEAEGRWDAVLVGLYVASPACLSVRVACSRVLKACSPSGVSQSGGEEERERGERKHGYSGHSTAVSIFFFLLR